MKKIALLFFLFPVLVLLANEWNLAKSNNQFGIDIYKETIKADENYIFSPLSISSALAMTYAGADGITKEEMRTVFYFPKADSLVHHSFSSLFSRYNRLNSESVEVQIANSLWIQDSYNLRKSYISLMAKYYNSHLFEVDYQNEPDKSAEKINSWVEKITRERIKDIVSPALISPETKLILCNAIYMKAAWMNPFEKHFTKSGEFWLDKKRSMQVPMMLKIEHYSYVEMDDFKAVKLSYDECDLAMVILLPNDIEGVGEVESFLDAELVSKIERNFKYKNIRLSLPKFKIETELNLNFTLNKLGMQSAFTENADFGMMEETNSLFISNVVHKAFIEIDENGTEAAAATVVMMQATSAGKPEAITDFKVDHPFIFYIQDTKSNTILFMGRVMIPNEFQEKK